MILYRLQCTECGGIRVTDYFPFSTTRCFFCQAVKFGLIDYSRFYFMEKP